MRAKSRMRGNFCPAMAVPDNRKMPDPITAPIPSAVSDRDPSVFCNLRSGVFRFRDQLVNRLAAENLLVGGAHNFVRWRLARGWVVTRGLISPERRNSALTVELAGPPFVIFEGWDFRMPPAAHYRFAWPRANFLTFGFFDPADSPGASAAFLPCAFCARCVLPFCVRLYSVLLYWP